MSSSKSFVYITFTMLMLFAFMGMAYASHTAPNLSKIPKCGTFSISSNIVNAIITTNCKWHGGMLNIYGAAGTTGAITLTITGANGKVYYNVGSMISWCNTYLASSNMPAQVYTVRLALGQGGGKCGNSTMSFQRPIDAPLCKPFTVRTIQDGTSVSGICKWTGGVLKIYATAGSRGTGSYTMTAGGKVYASNSLHSGCATLVYTANFPAKNYEITLNTGSVAGTCGNATVQLK